MSSSVDFGLHLALAMHKPLRPQPATPLPAGRWRLRDWIAAMGLFLATEAVVLGQNAHVAVLWDLSYTLDSSLRIALGQMPYRDFPLAHAPLTFLLQAAIIRLTGRAFFHHVLYAATVGGLGTVVAWRIALHTLHERVVAAWTVSLLLAVPLTVLGIYSILPFPSYDCDCVFSILVALLLLQRLEPVAADGSDRSRAPGLLRSFATGAALVVPLFFKQNIGLPFLLAALAAILLLVVARLLRRTSVPLRTSGKGEIADEFSEKHISGAKAHASSARFMSGLKPGPSTRLSSSAPSSASPGIRALLAVLAGAAATLLAAGLLIQLTAGVGNYIHWTIQFAAQRRLPGFKEMLGVYREPSLMWMLPCVAAGLVLLCGPLAKSRWTRWPALGLLAAPFLWTLFSLFLMDDADSRGDSLLALWPLLLILSAAFALTNLRGGLSLRALLPFVVLAAIHGALLSQQLWGSTYAIWPLLIVLIAEMIGSLGAVERRKAERDAASGVTARRMFLAPVLAAVIAATLLVCGGLYAASEERLSYANLSAGEDQPEWTVQHSALPALKGMAVPGPYLPQFDELLRFAATEIPTSDGLILIPGEDPFYFATGRIPRFPVLLFDPATQPYSPSQLAELARKQNIRWLIVKRNLQIKEDATPQREETLRLLQQEFTLYRQLENYDVYRRGQSTK